MVPYSLVWRSGLGCVFDRRRPVIVAEVTQPSLGVGYEIGRALDAGKRILCLFRPAADKSASPGFGLRSLTPSLGLSAMIRGAENGSTFQVYDYTDLDDLLPKLAAYFAA